MINVTGCSDDSVPASTAGISFNSAVSSQHGIGEEAVAVRIAPLIAATSS